MSRRERSLTLGIQWQQTLRVAARRCARLGPLLREVGLDRAASFCDLIRLSHDFSRGVNSDGAAVSPLDNSTAIKDLNSRLRSMRDACLKSLNQQCRGARRLRGFVTEELHELYQRSELALAAIIALCRANDMMQDLRATLPYSAVNETWHSLMRRVSKLLVISDVARSAGQVLEASLIIQDVARTWCWPVGCGSQSEYESCLEQSPLVRERALTALRGNDTRSHDLIRHINRRASYGRTSRSAASPKMHNFVVASNVGRESVKVSFRDAIARNAAGDAAKYGKHNSKRRDILSRSMDLPSLLKREQPGRPRVFQASRVVVVDGRGTRRLDCGLATSTVVCRLKSKPAILELAILSKPSESFTVSFSSIQAIVMGLDPNARPSDTNGVVTITFAIVGHGHLQLLSITLLKKDINTC